MSETEITAGDAIIQYPDLANTLSNIVAGIEEKETAILERQLVEGFLLTYAASVSPRNTIISEMRYIENLLNSGEVSDNGLAVNELEINFPFNAQKIKWAYGLSLGKGYIQYYVSNISFIEEELLEKYGPIAENTPINLEVIFANDIRDIFKAHAILQYYNYLCEIRQQAENPTTNKDTKGKVKENRGKPFTNTGSVKMKWTADPVKKTKLYGWLKEKFIDPETSIENFYSIFNHQVPSVPVKWMKYKPQLILTLITLIANKLIYAPNDVYSASLVDKDERIKEQKEVISTFLYPIIRTLFTTESGAFKEFDDNELRSSMVQYYKSETTDGSYIIEKISKL